VKSAKADAQVPAIAVKSFRNLTIIQRATAPEMIRTEVKVAASMPVCFSAARQRRELLAKAIIVSEVRMRIRADFTSRGPME
jgi:hypothetical protein